MYLFTIIINYTIGYSFLVLIGYRQNRWESWGLAYPIGLGISTFIIFIMEIVRIPITLFSMMMAFFVVTASLIALIYPRLKNNQLVFNFSFIKNISPAEWIFLIAIAFFFSISLWRCFYLPVTPYDAIQGIDLVAKYTIEDGHINSRMFSDLKGQLSTQPYYAPFTMLSQTIYRISGHPFGTIWLSFMSLSLLIVLYAYLRRNIHPMLAGALTLGFFTIPEMYFYSFLIQTDYSNAIFVSLSVLYAYRFIKEKVPSFFIISNMLFGFGVWARSETMAFAVIMVLLLIPFMRTMEKVKPFAHAIIFLEISFFFFAIWNLYYLPVVLHYAPESYFKFGFWDTQRLKELWDGMIFIITATGFWGYILHFFVFILIINLIIFRDFKNIYFLLWIGLLLLGFFILLYHLQFGVEANINNTFRRGIFKIFPVVIFYIGTSQTFKRISSYITKFEVSHLPQNV